MTKEEILDRLPIESQGDYFREDVLRSMDECYNQAIDDSIAELEALSNNYPGGKTANGEFFTNPTRDALQYAISLIKLHKK